MGVYKNKKMPKSKRAKKVSLTQTRSKGLELKQKVIEEIRECCDTYARIFTFSVENMRNSKLKNVRTEWKHSRFFFGKNKVMARALGNGPEDELRPGLHKISKCLVGQAGLLCTNSTQEEVLKWFSQYSEADYARSGNTANQTVTVEAGPLPEFSHALEPQLRKLGLPTSLKRGVINLDREFVICSDGDTLTPEQAHILKLFGHSLAEFRLTLESVWSNDGSYKRLDACSAAPVQSPAKVTIRPKVMRKEDSLEDEDGLEEVEEMENEDEENEESGDDDIDDDNDIHDEGDKSNGNKNI